MQAVELPVISIVTPSFNQGAFLEECIDSVLSQNYPFLEYVIMDGGSTDNSLSIIKKYERYLTYWQSKPDGGQYKAIQQGFKKTTGPIMAWLNSDDKYHDRAFFTAAYVFSSNAHVDWITGRPTFWDKEGNLSFIFEGLPRYCRTDFLQKKYNDPFIQQESTFWRRSLWERAGGHLRTDLEYAGDLELWVRFFRIAQVYSVDALLGGYRNHGKQKAVYGMDKYVHEAEEVLDEEVVQVKNKLSPELKPSPEPISISPPDMITFFRTLSSPAYRLNPTAHQLFLYFQNRAAVTSPEDTLSYKLREAEARLAAMESSRSWSITRPLREIVSMAKRFGIKL